MGIYSYKAPDVQTKPERKAAQINSEIPLPYTVRQGMVLHDKFTLPNQTYPTPLSHGTSDVFVDQSIPKYLTVLSSAAENCTSQLTHVYYETWKLCSWGEGGE